MTRYARSGSTQQHRKMPGEGTPWSEFSYQDGSNPSKQNKRKKSFNFPNKSEQSQSSDSVVAKNMNAPNFSGRKRSFLKFSKKQKTCASNSKGAGLTKNSENIIETNIVHNADTKTSVEGGIDNQDDRESNCFSGTKQRKRTISSDHPVSVKKNKKNKFFKQHHSEQSEGIDTKNIANSFSSKVFEKNKIRYMDKLKKRREDNGILLLPSKIERKLYNIKRTLRDKGLPSAVLKDIIRKERRKEELKFRKTFNPSKPCFNCRQTGHLFADCPTKLGSSKQETGICFKCGSVEHTSFKCPNKVQGFPFAKCFICKEQGHISKDCPMNKHGVYPKGGRCNLCGNVNHLKKDCPSFIKKKEDEVDITLHTMNEVSSIDAEIMDEKNINRKKGKNAKKPKIVKF